MCTVFCSHTVFPCILSLEIPTFLEGRQDYLITHVVGEKMDGGFADLPRIPQLINGRG